MIKTLVPLVLVAIGAPAAEAAPGGQIGTLPLGRYACELPGDATGLAGVAQPAEDFRVLFGSRYQTEQGSGTYLLTGKRVVFTSGPLDNVAYTRAGTTFLRRLQPDGTEGRLRCVRQGGSQPAKAG